MAKKRNAQDTTLRNIRALKRRMVVVERALKALRAKVLRLQP